MKMAELLIERGGININAKTKIGETALRFACFTGHVEMVKLLLQHGANVNVVDNDG